jgi:CRISPR-associated endoribonuclease Cas6
MQLSFSFESDHPFVLPLQYNHLVQGFIYHAIDSDLARALHDDGFIVDGRSFRLFVFSRLMGNYQIDSSEGTITFGPKVTLWIASPNYRFCESLGASIFGQQDLLLGTHRLRSVEASGETPEIHTTQITVRTFSPITVYSTLLRPDGRKYTAYFQPGDPDYDQLVTDNLGRKFRAAFDQPPPEGMVRVRSLGRLKLNVVRYKGFIIKGYSGRLRLQGPPPLLQLALNAGLGAKNSQGFGFVRMS